MVITENKEMKRTVGYTLDQTRVVNYQFKRNGLVHLTTVHDYQFADDPTKTLHVSPPYGTFCGKNIPIGTGGWGYGPKMCTSCHTVGAKAERIDP